MNKSDVTKFKKFIDNDNNFFTVNNVHFLRKTYCSFPDRRLLLQAVLQWQHTGKKAA